MSERKQEHANTYKVVEIVGSSPTSTDDAIRNAIADAAKSIKHIDWFEVTECRGHIQDGNIQHFQVSLKLGFRVET